LINSNRFYEPFYGPPRWRLKNDQRTLKRKAKENPITLIINFFIPSSRIRWRSGFQGDGEIMHSHKMQRERKENHRVMVVVYTFIFMTWQKWQNQGSAKHISISCWRLSRSSVLNGIVAIITWKLTSIRK
jgi:hypothetical protein